MAEEKKKKRLSPSQAWRDARELVWAHRGRLALGMALMLVNRLVGLVLPASSKYLVDEVIIKHRAELLSTIARDQATERSSGGTEPQAYAGDTVQHVSRGSRDQRPAGDEGTAERGEA